MKQQLVWVALSVAMINGPAFAENHSIGARLGMLGFGAEYAYRINDLISVRAGLNGASYGFDETESGIDYAFDLEFDTLSVGVDIYPLQGRFRVSLGAMQNDNGLSARSNIAQTFTIGGTTYQAADVGTLYGNVGFDSTAPYLGVGWDWLREKTVGMTFEMGVLSQGSPVVSLRADGPIADDAGFIADLAAEQAELQDDLDSFDVYPYAMLGVVFRF